MKELMSLIYLNPFGKYKILVTGTISQQYSRHAICKDMEIYSSHIWIHDNVIKKNHTGIDINCDGLSAKEIVNLFEKMINRTEIINKFS